MPIRVRRLLAVLLAVALGFGPTGMSWANNHACETDDGGISAVTGHAGHVQQQPGLLDDMAATQPVDNCHDCPPDCCNGAACNGKVCGGGIVALRSDPLPLLGPRVSDLSTTERQMALSERLTSFFRPPRA